MFSAQTFRDELEKIHKPQTTSAKPQMQKSFQTNQSSLPPKSQKHNFDDLEAGV